ncbi:GmrSD restriction endonuclease domain-containing protein [Mucilaginibacter sp. FT3.2]|uniref:GmrSD restriction endonuclease domain-containing protein n=1 Tax=Mucilaginibacter sp. FT3.2 TaxID=2723090 RepID=UPI001620EB9F|nr:DUF262 domain-containing protein [Mucilaginibacter sp. FT3.2]MBB6230868.1 hypothetical protein [Mucilaginibacter sp. FT3.2]
MEETKIADELEEEILFDDDNDDDEPDLGENLSTKIYTEQGDPEIDGLYQRWKRGKLDVQPDFQRYFVWDIVKSSKLLESALLDIPLPVVYLTEEMDGKIYVIDGQQRLTSFFAFIDGLFPDKKGKPFKLSGLKVLKEYQGKLFAQLPEDVQDQIRYCKIRTITFKKESNPNLKFEIFERLNTGSVPLNTQELRNCIYRGSFNNLLKELAAEKDFLDLLGLKQPDRRMKDVELVLRFCSFYHNTHINYKSPIKNFLNNEITRFVNISDRDAEQLRQAFKKAISIIKSLFAENAFKRYYKGTESNPDGYWERSRFNTSLYDILMDSFARAEKTSVYPKLDAIREAFINLMTTDDEFIDAIEIGTSEERKVVRRFDKWRNTLNNIIGERTTQPRCFSFSLKEQLYSTNSTCQICGNNIANIDDAAVDHIEQYWLGGKTIPENARLTHRYCNAARPRKE